MALLALMAASIPLALAGKLFILWILGVPGGLLILAFILFKVFA